MGEWGWGGGRAEGAEVRGGVMGMERSSGDGRRLKQGWVGRKRGGGRRVGEGGGYLEIR